MDQGVGNDLSSRMFELCKIKLGWVDGEKNLANGAKYRKGHSVGVTQQHQAACVGRN